MERGQDGEHLGGHLLCHGAPAQELSVPRSHVETHTHTLPTFPVCTWKVKTDGFLNDL